MHIRHQPGVGDSDGSIADPLQPPGSHLVHLEVNNFSELLANFEFDDPLLRRVKMVAGKSDGGGKSEKNGEMETSR